MFAAQPALADTLRIDETYYAGRLIGANADHWLFDIDCEGVVYRIELDAEVQVDVSGECENYYPAGIGGSFPGLCEINRAVKSGKIAAPRFLYLAIINPDDVDAQRAGFTNYFSFEAGIPTIRLLDDEKVFPGQPFGIRVFPYKDIQDWCEE